MVKTLISKKNIPQERFFTFNLEEYLNFSHPETKTKAHIARNDKTQKLPKEKVERARRVFRFLHYVTISCNLPKDTSFYEVK